jgi:hypothetical protein
MSKGINVYERARDQFGSIIEAKASELTKQAAANEPCIFLSHIRGDKKQVTEFGNYIKNAGIDIYLDIEDKELLAAEDAFDDEKITLFVEAGIRRSTHLMIFLSEATRKSWWVPFEIGFGKAAKKSLSCVKLRDVKISDLSYLKIVPCLQTLKELDGYLAKIPRKKSSIKIVAGKHPTIEVDLLAEKSAMLFQACGAFHPLAVYMDKE